jgi:diguanylate cyclase (GGDEF)-like protein/PAS domain S-box-containing protein
MTGGEVVQLDASTDVVDPLTLLQVLPDPVVVIDRDTRIIWGNAAAEEWSGWRLEEWADRSAAMLVHPDDLATAMASLTSVQAKEVGTPVEMRFRDRHGTYRRFEVRGRTALDVHGVDGIVLSLRDVTERRRWEVGQGKGSTLQAIIDHAPAITMLLDGDGTLRSASRAFTNLLGHDLERAVGEHLASFADAADAERVRAQIAAASAEAIPVTFEAAFEHVSSGLTVPLSLTVVNLLDDHAVEGLVVTAVDITQLAEARARLQHLATHDALTGLPNRALFIDRLDHALAMARRRGTEVVLIYGDVDHFKQINDEHGHPSGDAVLVEVASRIRGAIRESDTVARIGGDEFVVLLEDDDPITTRDRIAAALAPPVELPDGASATVRLSCGVTTSAGHVDMASLLAAADAAMYRTKQR